MIGHQKTAVIGVVIKDGKITKIDITLQPEAIELEDEVVIEAKALRNTGVSLLKERQKASALSDPISTEEISRGESDQSDKNQGGGLNRSGPGSPRKKSGSY